MPDLSNKPTQTRQSAPQTPQKRKPDNTPVWDQQTIFDTLLGVAGVLVAFVAMLAIFH